MNERKDEQWLDGQVQRAVGGSTPAFDAEAWKLKHSEEYHRLLARSRQPVRWGLPHRAWSMAIGKLAVAAAIAVAVGLFVLSRNTPGPDKRTVSCGPVADSAAEMMTMRSLRLAYEQGGEEALNRQLDMALDQLGPRLNGPATLRVVWDLDG